MFALGIIPDVNNWDDGTAAVNKSIEKHKKERKQNDA
jgi:hypothetical protein